MLVEWELADPELAVRLYQEEECWEVSEELGAVFTEEWVEWE